MNFPRFPVLAAFAACCLLPALARADDVMAIHYDGLNNDYGLGGTTPGVANFTPALTDTVNNGDGTSSYVYGYNSSIALTAGAANYTGPAIYGGYWMSTSDAAHSAYNSPRVHGGFTTAHAFETAPVTQIELAMTTAHDSGTVATTGAGLIAFQQQSFAGVPGSTYSFSANSTLSLTVNYLSQASVRFAVESGGQWYVSSASESAIGTLSLAGTALLGNEWAALSLADGPGGWLDGAPATFDVAGTSLTDIQAVGYFSTYNETTANQYADISDFSAGLNASAVPEPPAAAMLTLGAVVLLFLAVRRRDLLGRSSPGR